MDSRLELLKSWVDSDLNLEHTGIVPASADASFRRYFRIQGSAKSFIVMDAPPDRENLESFLRVAQILLDFGINVPRILARNLAQGFLLLSDLGSRQYLDELKAGAAVGPLYADALRALAHLQIRGRGLNQALPAYDAALLSREMQLMPEWFCARHLGLVPEDRSQSMLESLFDRLIQNALEQPATLVHRDYHSRNLMLCEDQNPGVLDFQDAVYGPITYDLVSILKDCYICWPEDQVRGWALAHRERLASAGFATGNAEAEFLRWFDLMGLQRHIKVLGIFARLWYRDGKSAYLKDLPLVLSYVRRTANQYAELTEFAAYIAAYIDPAFAIAQRRESL